MKKINNVQMFVETKQNKNKNEINRNIINELLFDDLFLMHCEDIPLTYHHFHLTIALQMVQTI